MSKREWSNCLRGKGLFLILRKVVWAFRWIQDYKPKTFTFLYWDQLFLFFLLRALKHIEGDISFKFSLIALLKDVLLQRHVTLISPCILPFHLKLSSNNYGYQLRRTTLPVIKAEAVLFTLRFVTCCCDSSGENYSGGHLSFSFHCLNPFTLKGSSQNIVCFFHTF